MTTEERERTRTFILLLKKNKAKPPVHHKVILYAGEFLLVLAFSFMFFAPIISFDNGTTVSKSVNFTLFRLTNMLSPFKLAFVTIEFFAFFIGATMAESTAMLFTKFYLKRKARCLLPRDEEIEKENTTVKTMMMISIILTSVGLATMASCCILLSVSGNELFEASAHPGWTPCLGWGAYATLISSYLGLVIFIPAKELISIKSEYVNGIADELDVLSLFRCAKPADAATAWTAVLTETLNELNRLKELGWITAEDYEKKKARLLGLQNKE